MSRLILVFLIMGMASCSTIKYRNIHIELELQKVCDFKKFTEEEKDYMTESIGMKIYSNQEACRIREKANLDKVKAHNEAHEN